jgi:hypothetical protein
MRYTGHNLAVLKDVRRELGAIGGEHETNHNPWKVASRFSRRLLEFVMSLDKCL